MDYGKIIEDYQKIIKEHEDCEKTLKEEYEKLTQNIKESLREVSLTENSEEILLFQDLIIPPFIFQTQQKSFG